MKVLAFMQILMRFGGILPMFEKTFLGKCMEALKLIAVVITSIYIIIATFAFGIVNSHDLRLLTRSLYVSVGTLVTVSLHLSLCFQSDKISSLLNEIEALVNESEYFHVKFYKYFMISTENKLEK